jgi:hypothetical protein
MLVGMAAVVTEEFRKRDGAAAVLRLLLASFTSRCAADACHGMHDEHG